MGFLGRHRWSVTLTLVAIAVAFYAVAIAAPSGPPLRSFDPDQTALMEIDMWQAYYKKEDVRMFKDLVTITHEQYHYPWSKAVRASFYLARAAATFGNLRADYDQVLPDLERAYAIAKEWTGATYDPAAAARAELAWWVQRRVPGKNSPEEVGALIADLDAMVYAVPRERVLKAAVLRAAAGRLRDDGGENADWAAVSRLLVESYRELRLGVTQ